MDLLTPSLLAIRRSLFRPALSRLDRLPCSDRPHLDRLHLDKRLSVVAIALLAVVLTGCFGDRNTSDSNGDESISNGPAVLRNTATDVSIVVPEGWIKMGEDMRRSHDIYAAQPEQQLYATVLSEDETGISQFGLEDNSAQYRELIKDELDNFEGETRTSVNRIDGRPALQYEIRGTVDDQSVVYLHTTVEGTNDYYQVVGWTSADRYRENKNVLEKVVESFEGI